VVQEEKYQEGKAWDKRHDDDDDDDDDDDEDDNDDDDNLQIFLYFIMQKAVQYMP
jgi:hypothetical protein